MEIGIETAKSKTIHWYVFTQKNNTVVMGLPSKLPLTQFIPDLESDFSNQPTYIYIHSKVSYTIHVNALHVH